MSEKTLRDTVRDRSNRHIRTNIKHTHVLAAHAQSFCEIFVFVVFRAFGVAK